MGYIRPGLYYRPDDSGRIYGNPICGHTRFWGSKIDFFSIFPKMALMTLGHQKWFPGPLGVPNNRFPAKYHFSGRIRPIYQNLKNRDFCHFLMILAFSELIWGGRIRPEVAGINIFCVVCVLGTLETLLHTGDVII